MNSRNKIILSGALIALVMLVTTNVFVASSALADSAGTTITPQSAISVYIVKKVAKICDNGQSAPEDQFPPQIGGCVDTVIGDDSLVNLTISPARYNQYLFSGEVLAELVVARDLSGGQFLNPTADLLIDGSKMVTCTALPAHLADHIEDGTALWMGHNLHDLLEYVLPPVQGVIDHTGYDPMFDKIYECYLTVTPTMVGSPSAVAVKVSDSFGQNVTSDSEKWFFNPSISIDISFTSGSQIMFPAAQAGQTVISLNSMLIKNTADGGVDLAAYLVGHDLKDTSGTGACFYEDPRGSTYSMLSNVLNVNNLWYRCKVGTVMSEQFTPLQHIKTSAECMLLADRQCLVVPEENNQGPTGNGNNDLLPDAASAMTSILYNQHQAECSFKLNVPFPCVGTYSASDAVEVLVRAI